ncbi:MAG: flagellar FliJ family protein [Proteobacteria bacterium]|nr:flagellar FliJ family protein [Pseudomonadota bacterium]
MKALATLVRLHKQLVNEKRAELTEIEVGREALRDQSDRLAAEVESEKQFAAGSFEGGRSYPRYVRRIDAERRVIATEIAKLDAAIVEAGEALAAAYQDLKKYEITYDIRAGKLRAAAAKRDQAQLDEIAITLHRRKHAG